jgi:hypothetical protein
MQPHMPYSCNLALPSPSLDSKGRGDKWCPMEPDIIRAVLHMGG